MKIQIGILLIWIAFYGFCGVFKLTEEQEKIIIAIENRTITPAQLRLALCVASANKNMEIENDFIKRICTGHQPEKCKTKIELATIHTCLLRFPELFILPVF